MLRNGNMNGGVKVELQKNLIKLCSILNRLNIKYIVIGGCAVILHGYRRTTFDIDILVDQSTENVERLKKALNEAFHTEEAYDIHDNDVATYTVVRFAPESEDIVVDIMGKVGEIDFEVARNNVETIDFEGVTIPVCGLATLIETKKGIRPKDKDDLLFLIGKKEYLESNKDE
jgi:predicted nucleotidyltransferase